MFSEHQLVQLYTLCETNVKYTSKVLWEPIKSFKKQKSIRRLKRMK